MQLLDAMQKMTIILPLLEELKKMMVSEINSGINMKKFDSRIFNL